MALVNRGPNKRFWIYSISFLFMAMACSSKKDIKPDDLSAAAPIALEEKSDSANTADATIFLDLDPAKAADISKNLEADETAGLATKPSDSQEAATDSGQKPFYNPIGGESLGRVAYTLYGSRKQKQQLISQNPDLKDAASLQANQKVFFSFESLNPRPMYLTKGLLDSYPSELAEHIDTQEKLEKGAATIQSGETLQKLSQRLYGTTRYWTEIYLLNHDKLAAGYDRVASGTELSIIKRDSIPAAAIAKVEKLPVDEEIAVPSPKETIVEKQAEVPAAATPVAPTTQPVLAQAPPPPIPPPPPVVNSPPPQMNTQPKEQSSAQIEKASGDDQAALIRRGIYVALIVSIAGIAFYLTRPSKKKNFDMLDVTSQAAASGKRPKLVDQDDDSKFVG